MRLTSDNWRGYKKESPGGPLMSFTVHHADNLNYLIGPIKKLTAYTNKICGPAETDDVVSAIVQFENGALGYIGGSFITPDRKFLQIHGTEGVLLLEEDDGSISYQKKGTKHMVKSAMPNADIQRLDSLIEEIGEFAHCIQTGEKPEVTGAVGMDAIAIIEAIYRSAESNVTINVQDLLLNKEVGL
jgi:predicted dehydrogenase